MNQEQAYELGKKHIESNETVIVLSDGSVYLNNPVKYMQDYALSVGMEAFVLKGEDKEKEPVKEVKEVVLEETTTDEVIVELPKAKKQSKK